MIRETAHSLRQLHPLFETWFNLLQLLGRENIFEKTDTHKSVLHKQIGSKFTLLKWKVNFKLRINYTNISSSCKFPEALKNNSKCFFKKIVTNQGPLIFYKGKK